MDICLQQHMANIIKYLIAWIFTAIELLFFSEMPIESLISAMDPSSVIVKAGSINGSISKQNAVKGKTVSKRSRKKSPTPEPEANKITSYFTAR